MKPPLLREHRLYQADWLIRFYGFEVDEVTKVQADGMLDLAMDPKLAWALAHRGVFPVNVNRASREELLRVPGFGTRSVKRILDARRSGKLGYADLVRIGAKMRVAKAFVSARDWSCASLIDQSDLRSRFTAPSQQLSLFG